MLKPIWETLNLNISPLRQKLKYLEPKILGKEFLIPCTDYFLSSITTQEGDVSDRQTSIMGV